MIRIANTSCMRNGRLHCPLVLYVVLNLTIYNQCGHPSEPGPSIHSAGNATELKWLLHLKPPATELSDLLSLALGAIDNQVWRQYRIKVMVERATTEYAMFRGCSD